MIELLIARELLPELDFFSVQELHMLLLLFLGRFDLHVDFTAGLLDEAIVILEMEVDLGRILARKVVECLLKPVIIELGYFELIIHFSFHRADRALLGICRHLSHPMRNLWRLDEWRRACRNCVPICRTSWRFEACVGLLYL
jgi:hypothetical protein